MLKEAARCGSDVSLPVCAAPTLAPAATPGPTEQDEMWLDGLYNEKARKKKNHFIAIRTEEKCSVLHYYLF